MPKNVYHTTGLILHASKVMLKFSKRGFNTMWAKNFQMLKLDLEKAEEPETKLPTSIGSWKKQESSSETSTSAKAFDCVDHNKLWKILKEMGIPEHWLASWETYMQVRKQQLELDMEHHTGSK